MRNCVIFTVALAFSGCATVVHNYVPQVTSFSLPEIGIEVEARLGEPLLDQGLFVEDEVLQTTNEFTGALYLVRPGKFIKTGEDADYEHYRQDIISGLSIFTGRGSSASSTASIRIRKSDGEFCIIRTGDLTICPDSASFQKSKEQRITENNFRKTLIYSGRVGDKVRVSYREFADGMARSAFTNEVEYDLSTGSTIGYASAEIEVISATNTSIRYKVISNFD